MTDSPYPGNPDPSRRVFLGAAAGGALAAGLGAANAAPAAAASAASTNAETAAARTRHGDLRDVRHVVVIMQENRSFDHYFGSLAGVRGFADRSTITLPGGLSVFEQPTGAPGEEITTTQFPWHLSDAPASAYPDDNEPPSAQVGAQGYGGTPHSWDDQHLAWNGGLMNGWVEAKEGLTTLGYLDRRDIPFHYALADAYTVGDAYFCSVLSATGPNRTYLWGGTIDAQKKFGDYTANAGGDEVGKKLAWKTYAEGLQEAGYSWRIYQGSDNYGDNGLQYFATFAALDPSQGGTADPGNPLYERALSIVDEPSTADEANGDNLIAAVRADVEAGTLPQVSWVVSNQTFSEHPDGAPNDGAYLIHGVLKALAADPDVLNSTLVVIDYDENDGQFDHVPPPVAPEGTTDELYQEESGTLTDRGVDRPVPVGLGFRVPLLLVSPWTRGGWVTSEVSDHTSVLQFMERWTAALGNPVVCSNISDWRRSVCGDLTAAFDFANPVHGLPDLPDTGAVLGDPPDGAYEPPVTTNEMPQQESGTRPARPLPYQPGANLEAIDAAGDGSVLARLSLTNHGDHALRAAHFAVYSAHSPATTLADDRAALPGQYTVAPTRTEQATQASVEIGTGYGDGVYDLTVVGPNRFLRRFTGDVSAAAAHAVVRAVVEAPSGRAPRLALKLVNSGRTPLTFTVTANHYSTARPHTFTVHAHSTITHRTFPYRDGAGWYDLSVTVRSEPGWSRRFVGRLENGLDGVTG